MEIKIPKGDNNSLLSERMKVVMEYECFIRDLELSACEAIGGGGGGNEGCLSVSGNRADACLMPRRVSSVLSRVGVCGGGAIVNRRVRESETEHSLSIFRRRSHPHAHAKNMRRDICARREVISDEVFPRPYPSAPRTHVQTDFCDA